MSPACVKTCSRRSPASRFTTSRLATSRRTARPPATLSPARKRPAAATWIVQPGDVITSTVRPNRCLTRLIEPEQAENICSSGFAVLTPKGIPGELLFAYLRLPVICELMDLHTTASMYPAISTTDLMRLPFLLPDEATIKKAKQQITAARAARREAHALLENAKQAVEVAIEKNEAAGMALLAK